VIFGEQYRLLSSLLCILLHSPVTSYLLGPNILLSTVFSVTLSLCFSLNTRPYKTTGKIIVVSWCPTAIVPMLLYAYAFRRFDAVCSSEKRVPTATKRELRQLEPTAPHQAARDVCATWNTLDVAGPSCRAEGVGLRPFAY